MAGELWRRRVADVIEALGDAKGECVVLIGAGCSFSAGIPLAGGLIREISEKFPATFARAKENGHHRSYNTLMRELNPKQRRKLLHGHIEKARINWAHLALAQLFKNEKIDRVLTVNFDPLLVRACALVGYYPAIYDLATASYFDSAVIAPNSIFYLNGQHTGFAILNADDELDPHRERLREIVKDTGTGRTWIVVGYSGDADPLLEIIAEHPNFGGGLYWVGHADDPSPELKEKLLQPGNGKTKNAFYLGGQDADKFFLKLAQALKVFPPKIIENPFAHVRELLEDINFETGDDYVKSLKPKLLQQLAHCETEIKRNAATTAEDTDIDPEQALLAGRYQDVLGWYLGLDDPSDADKKIAAWAYVMIGNALNDEANALVADDLPEARRRWALAGEKYAAALAIKPDKHEALCNWGNALDAEANALVADDLPEARRCWALAGEKYAAALAIKPDKHEALYNWGSALNVEANALVADDLPEARRRWALAGEKYAAALAIKPDKHEALNNWGYALNAEANALVADDLPEARRRWALAGEKYAAALAIKPDMHDALNNWGSALNVEAKALVADNLPEARQRWALAGEKYAAALAIKPDKHEALCNWGNALDAEANALVADDLPEARRCWALAGEKYAAALAIKPDDHYALGNLSNACLQQWHAISDPQKKAALLTQAKTYCQQAEALAPGKGAYNLACCHALEADVEECLHWLEVADQHKELPDREHLLQDRDLDPVRETPAFQAWWQARFSDSP